MIHYHGTPVGGSRQDVARFLMGRHALIPFVRKDDTGSVLECCQSFILDNGAFSYWKKGNGRIDFDDYFDWCKNLYRHPSFDWCLIPDVIDGDESENRGLVIKWLRIGSKIKGVPVYHMHESFQYFEWLVSNFDTVAIGSSGMWNVPGSKKWWLRIDEIMRIACNSKGQPKCKLHGLRMLDPGIFTKLPLSSADSTNAAVNCGSLSRFGIYIPPTAAQRAAVIADRIEMFNSSPVYNSSTQISIFDDQLCDF